VAASRIERVSVQGDDRTLLPERNLDVLRTVAVLAVMADHLGIALQLDAVRWYGHWAGRCGVLMFFVHTSLVLMASLERNRDDPHWIRSFYVRRAMRIYPLAVVAILLMLAFRIPPVNSHGGVIRPFVMPDWATIVANLALAQNLFGLHKVGVVLWTLPIEVEMYVLLPLCFPVAWRGPRAVVVLLSLAAAMYVVVSHEWIRGSWRVAQVFRYAPCFLAGVLAYAMLRARRWRRIIPGAMWVVALPLTIVYLAMVAERGGPRPIEWGYALVLGLAIPLTRELGLSCLTRAAHTVATYSYGLYLAHVPAMWFSFVILRPAHWALQAVVLAALLVLLPWLGYRFIERPGIDLGSRLVRGRRAMLAATAPAP
jgi:peptidoglycan/LPS O-acetylase OafA/YrhL